MANEPASKNVAPMVLGIISIVLGVIGSILSLIPCCGLFFGMPLGGIGLLLAVIGVIVALVSKQGMVLPIVGALLSVLSLLIGLAWIGFGVYAGNEANKQAEADRKAVREAAAPTTITAVELGKKYTENGVSADTKYKNQILEVSGEVVSVDDIGIYTTVRLKTDDVTRPIMCNFDKDQSGQALALKAGKQATIRGKFEGQLLNQLTMRYCVVK